MQSIDISGLWFWNIVASNTVIAAGLAVVVSVLSRFWKNRAALHIGWMLVLVKLWLPPLFALPLVLPFAPAQFEAIAPTPQAAKDPAASVTDSDTALIFDLAAASTERRSAIPNAQGATPQTSGMSLSAWKRLPWLGMIAGVWATGTLSLLSMYALTIVRFRRLLRFAEPVSSEVSNMATSLSQQFGLRRVPDVVTVPVRVTPLVWAVGCRPRIVLPKELCQRLDEVALRCILLHELAHIQRRDHLVRIFELASTVVFWWHPVTWIAFRQLRELEEECCDAVVLRMADSSVKNYAITLVDILDFLQESPAVTPVVATTLRSSASLEKRIKRLHENLPLPRLGFIHLLLLTALIGGPLAIGVAAQGQSEVPASAGLTIFALAEDEEPAEQNADDQKKEKKTVLILSAPIEGDELARLNEIIGALPITVRGQATDPEGKPIAGATVYVVAMGYGVPSKSIGTATTDSTGHYVISDVQLPLKTEKMPHGQFQIYGAAPGHGVAWIGQRHLMNSRRPEGDAEPAIPEWLYLDDPLVFDLKFGQEASVQGRIVDEKGEPVVGAKIAANQCYSAPGTHERNPEDRYLRAFTDPLSTITNEDGRFKLAGLVKDTAVSLSVEHPQYGQRLLTVVLADEPEAFLNERKGSAFTGDVNLTLQSAEKLHLVLQYGDTMTPAVNTHVVAWKWAENAQVIDSGDADATGAVDLLLVAGTYTLNIIPDRASAPAEFIKVNIPLNVPDAPNEQTQVVSIPQASTLEVEVIDADTGQPVPSISIATNTAWENPRSVVTELIGATDSDGRFQKLVHPGKRQ